MRRRPSARRRLRPRRRHRRAHPGADTRARGRGRAAARRARGSARARRLAPTRRSATYLADPQAMTRASQLFRAVCTGYCHSTQQAPRARRPTCSTASGPTARATRRSSTSSPPAFPTRRCRAFGERLPHEDLWKLVAYMRQKSTCK